MNNFFKKNIGWLIFGILALTPVIRWFLINNLNFKFSNISSIATSLGQIAGILGMVLFALNLITGSKIKIVDKIFFGLPDALNFHAIIGALGFCLILFHPILLAVRYLNFSISKTAMFFVPQGFDAISWGIYALGIMILLMVLTYYVKLKYNIWLFTHKFMILAFVLAFAHIALIDSDISRDLFLRYYVLGISIISIVVYLYNVILDKIFYNNLEYNIIRVDKLAENITQIELEPKAKFISFIPGQFVFIKFKSNNLTQEAHPFSISSDNNQKNLEFTIKSLGDFTSKISNLKVGGKAFVKGAFGKFSCNYFPNTDQIWISGGIGITPFLSMARSLPKNNNQKIDLYYCVKNKSEAILLDKLKEIEKNNKYFRVISWFSDEQGLINAENIAKLSDNINNKNIFICGPVSFMNNLKLQLIKIGVKNNNIHWEKFSFNN